jgi:hypothetical protein
VIGPLALVSTDSRSRVAAPPCSGMNIEAISKNDKGDLSTAHKDKLVMLDLLDERAHARVRVGERRSRLPRPRR